MLTLRESDADTQPDSASLRAIAFAGTFAALSASLLICRVPEAQPGTLSARALLWIAGRYLSAPAAIGLVATWLYFQFSTVEPAQIFRSLVRCLCEAWLFFPALTLLLWENSPIVLILAPLAAIAVTLSLERFLPDPPPVTPTQSALLTPGDLFAEPPPLPSRSRAIWMALALVAAAAEIADRDLATAGFILSLVSYLLIRQWFALTKRGDSRASGEARSPGVGRLSTSLALAFLLTLVALVPWLRRATPLMLGAEPSARNARHPRPGSQAIDPADAWHAIVLWPYPPRQNQLLPVPRTINYRPGESSKPLIVPFNGSYRYFQTPGEWIAGRAHSAHSSPLAVDIHSADWGPLFEEAHQPLTVPIDLACCRAIQVDVRNADNRRGGIVLGLVLSDSKKNSPRPAGQQDPFMRGPVASIQSSTAHSLALTPQPVLTSFPAAFTMKSLPVSETLTFVIPFQPRLRRFDEISVVFLPEPQRAALGAKIAIQQFALIPR